MPYEPNENEEAQRGLSRRRFLRGAGAGAVAGAVLPGAATDANAAAAPEVLSGKVKISLNINGMIHAVTVEPRTTLLDALRDHLDLTGAKKVCDRGACGACTIMVDGKTAYSCMMLAVDARGKKIMTVEGLAAGNQLHVVQQALIDHDALQCGFCTPGFVMSAYALLQKNPNPSDHDIRAGVAGNLCRCGTYQNMFAAVRDAASRMRGGVRG